MTDPHSSETTRPVLVLGGASDIGLAIAHRFAAAGFPIQLAARRPEALDADRSDIALRHGVEATVHRFDALKLDHIEAFYDNLPTLPGIVVCAVGLLGDQVEAGRNPRHARLIADSNFVGPAAALEEAARRLAALDEDTAIIGIGSAAGDRGRAKNYWYGAAKAAFAAVLSGLRQRYAKSRLRVVTVKPGFVATRMTEGMDLPPRLTSSPAGLAEVVYRAWRKGTPVVYSSLLWRAVMTIIRLLPEKIFVKTSF